MKQQKLSALKDRQRFKISDRKSGATYVLHQKKAGKALYSSLRSGLTFSAPLTKKVYPC